MNSEGFRTGKGRAGWLRVAAAVVAALALTAGASAQADARAARLSSVDGQVEIAVNNQVLASPAPVNTPLFEGTRITTADDGRAEVQFDDGSVARVAPNSSLIISHMRQDGGPAQTALMLDSGLAYFELQGMPSGGTFAVHFGANTVTASGFTVFRLDLDDLPGALAVFSGNVHLENPNALALDLHGGESARLNANDPTNYLLSESIEPNSWDAWNSDRDQQLTAQEAARTQATVNVPDAASLAWSDLNSNGNWYNVPGVGYVWSPYAASASGWDPYGCGYWVMTPAYGYVWASCYPWGFMPYAGGAWGFYDGLGWGWSPGGGGWWWNNGGWAPLVGDTAFRYSVPKRPHGGPISPGHGNPGGTSVSRVVAVNRFHSDGHAVTPQPRSGAVTIAGATVQPLKPVVVQQPGRNHAPSTGVVYTPVPAPVNRAGGVPASGFNQRQQTGTASPGMRPVYVPGAANGAQLGTTVVNGRQVLPFSGSGTQVQPGRPVSTPGSNVAAPRMQGGGMQGARPSGGAPAPSSGAMRSGGGASFGGGGMPAGAGGAPRSTGGGGSPHK